MSVLIGGVFKSIEIVVHNNSLKDVTKVILRTVEFRFNNKTNVKADLSIRKIEVIDDVFSVISSLEESREDKSRKKSSIEPSVIGNELKCMINFKDGVHFDCQFDGLRGKIQMGLIFDCIDMGYDIIQTIDKMKITSKSFKQDLKREEVSDRLVMMKAKVGSIQLGLCYIKKVKYREKRRKGRRKYVVKGITEFMMNEALIIAKNTTDELSAQMKFKDFRAKDEVNPNTHYPHIISVHDLSLPSLVNVDFSIIKYAPALTFSKSAKIEAQNIRYIHIQKFVKDLMLLGIDLMKKIVHRERLRKKRIRESKPRRSYLKLDVLVKDVGVLVPEHATEYNGVSGFCRELTVHNELSEDKKVQIFEVKTDSVSLHEIHEQVPVHAFVEGFSLEAIARLCSRSLDPELEYKKLDCKVEIPGIELSLHPGQLQLLLQLFLRNIVDGLSSYTCRREIEFVEWLSEFNAEIMNTVSSISVPPSFLDQSIHVNFKRGDITLSDRELHDVLKLQLENYDFFIHLWENKKIVLMMQTERFRGLDIRKDSMSQFKQLVNCRWRLKFTKNERKQKYMEISVIDTQFTMTTSLLFDLVKIPVQMQFQDVLKHAKFEMNKLKHITDDLDKVMGLAKDSSNILTTTNQAVLVSTSDEDDDFSFSDQEEEDEKEEETEGEELEVVMNTPIENIHLSEKRRKGLNKKNKKKEEKIQQQQQQQELEIEKSVGIQIEVLNPKIEIVEDYTNIESRKFVVSTNVRLDSTLKPGSVVGHLEIDQITSGVHYTNDVGSSLLCKDILFPLSFDGHLDFRFPKNTAVRSYDLGGTLRSTHEKTVSISYSDLHMGLNISLNYIKRIKNALKFIKEEPGRIKNLQDRFRGIIREKVSTQTVKDTWKSFKTNVIDGNASDSPMMTMTSAESEDDLFGTETTTTTTTDDDDDDVITSEEKELKQEEDDENNPIIEEKEEEVSFRCKLSSDNLFLELVDDAFGYKIPLFNVNLVDLSSEVHASWKYSKMLDSKFTLCNTFNIFTNYYNFGRNSYEPILEQREKPFRFRFAFVERKGMIEFACDDDLNINITHEMLDTVVKTASIWISQTKKSWEQKPITEDIHRPSFGIVNNSGLGVEFWRPKEGDVVKLTRRKVDFDIPLKLHTSKSSSSASLEELEGENDVTGNNNDDNDLENIKQGYDEDETFCHLFIERVNVQVRISKIKSMLIRYKPKQQVVVSVSRIKGQKVVNIHTGYSIKNTSSKAWMLEIFDSKKTSSGSGGGSSLIRKGTSFKLYPQCEYFFSYSQIQSGSMKILPADVMGKYHGQVVKLDELMSKCGSTLKGECPIDEKPSKSKSTIYYCLFVEQISDYEVQLEIQTPLSITNLLPCDLALSIYYKDEKTSTQTFVLKEGAKKELHTLNMNNTIKMDGSPHKEAWKYIGYPITISEAGASKTFVQNSFLLLRDNNNRDLRVRINYNRSKKYSLEIEIYVNYWIFNRIGIPDLEILTSYTISSCPLAGQGFEGGAGGRKNKFLFLHSNETDKLMISSGKKKSSPFAIDVLNKSSCVKLGNYDVGVYTKRGPGRYNLTKIVFLTPRYVMLNKSGTIVEIVQDKIDPDELKNRVTLQDGHREPFFWKDRKKSEEIRFRTPNSEWSSPIRLKTMGEEIILLKLFSDSRNKEEEIEGESDDDDDEKQRFLGDDDLVLKQHQSKVQPMLIRLQDKDGVVYIEFRKTGQPPYSVTNLTDFTIQIRQKKQKKYTEIPAGTSDFPFDVSDYYSDRTLECTLGGGSSKERKSLSINMQQIGKEIKVNNFISPNDVDAQKKRTLYVGVTAVNRTRNITFSYEKFVNITKTMDGFKNDVLGSGFLEIRCFLKKIGVSIVSNIPHEILYFSVMGMVFDAEMNRNHFWMTTNVENVQADNQTKDALYEVLLFNRKITSKPFLECSLVFCYTETQCVYIPYFSLCIQEVVTKIDLQFLEELAVFADGFVSYLEQMKDDEASKRKILMMQDSSAPIQPIPEPFLMKYLYFDRFELHPILVNVTFNMKRSENEETSLLKRSMMISLLHRVATSLSTNVENVNIKLNCLNLNNPFLSIEQLFNSVVSHYTYYALFEIYKIFGSADLIGNPVGLFNDMTTGVQDMFYEPYNGSSSIQGFVAGIGKGTSGLIRHTVHGTMNTTTKFVGAASDALSVLALDTSYSDKRREKRVKNKAGDMIEGVGMGAKELGVGIKDGITGIVFNPIQGWEKSGVVGGLGGVVQGAVGTVVKPTMGAFDFVGRTTEGIKNTAISEKEMTRQRKPRVFGEDDVLIQFDPKKAEALHVLRNVGDSRFQEENYLMHFKMSKGYVVLLTVSKKVIYIHYKKGTHIVFVHDWSDFDKFQFTQKEGLKMNLVKPISGGFGKITKERILVRNSRSDETKLRRINNLLFDSKKEKDQKIFK